MSTTHTASSALKRRGLSAQFWRVGLLTLLAAVAINACIALAAHTLFTVSPTFVPLQFASVIPATAVAVTGALLVLALISRRSQQPVRLFRRFALLVLLVSIIPDLLLPVIGLYPGATLPEVGTLPLMHLVTALLCVSLAPRMIDTSD
jgi:Family of unknown function (DUF6069)